MKLCLSFIILLTALIAGAEDPEDFDTSRTYVPGQVSRARLNTDLLSEKLYVTVITPGDPHPFLLNTSTADLWKLSPIEAEWVYLGDPRGSGGRAGTFKLLPYQTGQVLVLDTTTGEAWLVDGSTWIEIDHPSARKTRYKGSQKTWDELWELFKKQSKDDKP